MVMTILRGAMTATTPPPVMTTVAAAAVRRQRRTVGGVPRGEGKAAAQTQTGRSLTGWREEDRRGG